MAVAKRSFFVTVEYEEAAPGVDYAKVPTLIAKAIAENFRPPKTVVQIDEDIYRNMTPPEISSLFDRHGYPRQ